MNDYRPSSPRRPRPARTWAKYGVALMLALVPTLVDAAGKKPKKTDGPYTITVGGSYTGRGQALVVANAVVIEAQVTDESGNQGLLIGTDLRIDGSHFRGAGLVCGRPATFSGRLDGYNGDKHFRGARVLCNFAEIAGPRGGRVAGVLRR